MLPHPILATKDDEVYVEQSILSMPELMDTFFGLLEQVFLEGKNEQTPRVYAVHHSIQSTLKVLATVPPSSYRRNDSESSVDELPKRLERMERLFLDDVVSVGPQALAWKKPVTRLAQEAAQHMRDAHIKFPFSSSFVRKGVTHSSVVFGLLIAMLVSSFLEVTVALLLVPLVRPPPVVGVGVGIISILFLAIPCIAIGYFFFASSGALQEFYTRMIEERICANSMPLRLSEQNDGARVPIGAANPLRVRRGRDTKKGYYTIPYGDGVGYIEGKHLDAQAVMIGFDEKFLITRWNIAAEVMTGFLENGCIGKPLSELVITPSGDAAQDITALQASRGDVMKVKLRAFATAPVTLLTIAAPILNPTGTPIGSILICANAKDNLGEHRNYIRDYFTSEVNLSISKLVSAKVVKTEGQALITGLQSFLQCAFVKQVDEFAREMLTEWEWTTAEQLLAQALRSSTLQHTRYVDPMFPATLCLHPSVPKVIATVLSALGVACSVKLQTLNPTGSIYSLAVTITPVSKENEKRLKKANFRENIVPSLRSICGNMHIDDHYVSLHFPCQVTAALEDVEDAAFKAFEARSERSIIDQTRAIVNCTVNVLTLITNLVDQHNISMILLKTMFVSLTSVRERHELEKRLKSSTNDVDVIVCDRGWLNSARELILSPDHGAIVVPIAEPGVSVASEGFQYVINTPISGSEIRRVLMDIGTVVSLKKNATTAREERERILTLRQDSPWTKGKLLGRGSFGAVYEAVSDLTGGKMAVKMFYFSADGEESINKLLNEIQIMCSLNHPNIVHYFHCERKNNNVNLFMELCDASLSDIIVGKTKKPANLTVVQIIWQVLTALTYLHVRGVAHRDVKPPNILLKGETVKITDFGTARQGKTSKDVEGTLRYMAPEVYRGEPHSSQCDIWSIGCLASELFACPPKFMDSPLLLADMTSAAPYLTNTTDNETLSDFLRRCFRHNPEQRPTAADLLLHPLFSPACSDDIEKLPTIFSPGANPKIPFAFSLSTQKE
ncbi:putative protein kinase [Trypanosoma grayi]|uniref:putative protein kinase n=1 Tax=Trypanosoma grayi TaxID=71804 RepID=UPI0004F46F82|nr:putative protein kinase [Trypanosoma grayi]KEG11034.1 putative protein kinase [Trypanosoma grayi]